MAGILGCVPCLILGRYRCLELSPSPTPGCLKPQNAFSLYLMPPSIFPTPVVQVLHIHLGKDQRPHTLTFKEGEIYKEQTLGQILGAESNPAPRDVVYSSTLSAHLPHLKGGLDSLETRPGVGGGVAYRLPGRSGGNGGWELGLLPWPLGAAISRSVGQSASPFIVQPSSPATSSVGRWVALAGHPGGQSQLTLWRKKADSKSDWMGGEGLSFPFP